MGVNFGINWATDFNNVIIFYVHRTSHRQGVIRRPPSHQNSKKTTDIWLWWSILGLFGPMNSIMSLDFRYAAPPAGQGSPTARRHNKIQCR